MKTMRMILMAMCLAFCSMMAHADETVTVTATNSDISENLDLRMVANLFGQAKDLAEFEQMLNEPDSAFSNLDLNGDGDVDYLRVVETADKNRHLVVIQAVLAKDVYQDVASIFVEKDEATESVTVQVIGDEYIYGANYIIEPVYIYRPYIYDWFWGPSWVAWHSPFYWGYWPTWWYSHHCIAYHLYWEHMYWHHHHHPVSYRVAHDHRPHYTHMRDRVSRSDYATRHPERSFAVRNASRNYSNARDIDRGRTTAVRNNATTRNTTGNIRVSTRGNESRTFGSANIRTNSRTETVTTRGNATRAEKAPATTTTTRRVATTTTTRTQTTTRTTNTPTRSATTAPATRRSTTTVTTPARSTSSSVTRSTTTAPRSSSTTMRSSSGSTMRSSAGTMSSGGGSMRSSGGGASRGGGSTRR